MNSLNLFATIFAIAVITSVIGCCGDPPEPKFYRNIEKVFLEGTHTLVVLQREDDGSLVTKSFGDYYQSQNKIVIYDDVKHNESMWVRVVPTSNGERFEVHIRDSEDIQGGVSRFRVNKRDVEQHMKELR
jgi:hypothetical protein